MNLRSLFLCGALCTGFTVMADPTPVRWPIAQLEMTGPVVQQPISHFVTIYDDGTVTRDDTQLATLSSTADLVAVIGAVATSDDLEDMDAGKPYTVGGGVRTYTIFQGPGGPVTVATIQGGHRTFLRLQFHFSQRIVNILNGFAAFPKQ